MVQIECRLHKISYFNRRFSISGMQKSLGFYLKL